MLDFDAHFKKIQHLREQLKRVEKTAQKKTDALEAELKKFMSPLKSICLKAVEEYNDGTGGTGMHIVSDSINLSVGSDLKTLSLFVELRNSNGYSPDEEFYDKIVKKYNTNFGAILNWHLEENAIPLKFGSLSFPSSYYMK